MFLWLGFCDFVALLLGVVSWFLGCLLTLVVFFFLVGFADLLYRDYHTDQKFTLTTYAANGAVSSSPRRLSFFWVVFL